jgi:hypothetical protein
MTKSATASNPILSNNRDNATTNSPASKASSSFDLCRGPRSYCLNYSSCLSQQNEGDSVSIRSGKVVPTETSRAASVVNEEETSWTDVNLDEQREDQQRPGNFSLVCV